MSQRANLTAGEVGYIFANMKLVSDARVGDTFYKGEATVEAEPGFQEARPMVFAGVYPDDPDDYGSLEKAIHKLALTDPAVTIYKESSAALGSGFRCGFLGLLHMDVFK
jgi:translation elongation factor EF-4